MIFPMSTSGGGTCMTTGPTDVCKTPSPAGPVPIPYPNIAMCNQAKGSSCAKKVKVQNKASCTTKTEISMSSGDEAGVTGGVVSSKFKGPGKYTKGSAKVKLEGQPATHVTSMISLNGGSNGNIPPSLHTAPGQTKVTVM